LTAGNEALPLAPEAVVSLVPQRLRWRQILISLVISLVLSVVLYLRIDVSAFTDSLRDVDYLLLAPFMVLHAMAWYVRAVRWRVLLTPFRAVSSTRLFRLVIIGAMISAVVPARAGEFWRAYSLGNQEGMSRSTVFGTIVVERVLDGLVVALLASVAALAIGPTSAMAILISSMVILFTLALGVVAVLARSERAQALALGLVRSLVPNRFRPLYDEKASLFTLGLGALKDSRVFVGAVMLGVAVYATDAASYWTLGEAFGMNVNPQSYLLVVAVGSLAIALPISLGGIGPFEFFVQQALTLLGVSSALALAYAVFVHGLTLAFVGGLGLLLIWAGSSALALRSKVQPVLGVPTE